MSSVLKALKKIESRKAETQLPVWPYRIDNRESMSRHTNRSWRRHRILGILIVVCTVALAGKLYFGSRNDAASSVPAADPPVKTDLPPAAEGKSETDLPRTGKNTEAETEPAPPPPAVVRPRLPRTALDTSSAELPVKPAVEVAQTAPEDNAGLILQALVWSERPEDRFVVVNGSILREGGVINGAIVSGIEPDYVTVRSGGTTWRLKYGQ